jgi:phage baseplate assembly protein V
MNALAELTRRLDNLIRPGTIAEVDHAKALCRVKTGNITTGWLPWFTRRAGSTNEWAPASIYEQCVVFSPCGEPAQGFVLLGLYSMANPANSADPAVHRTVFANGDFIEHNAQTGAYSIQATGHVAINAASLTITCSGAVSINGSRIDLN